MSQRGRVMGRGREFMNLHKKECQIKTVDRESQRRDCRKLAKTSKNRSRNKATYKNGSRKIPFVRFVYFSIRRGARFPGRRCGVKLSRPASAKKAPPSGRRGPGASERKSPSRPESPDRPCRAPPHDNRGRYENLSKEKK
ncbi:hypothetical protein EVAR_10756_1 [Eumeta japonica]|uniref:Uncharacterized protein n=1 Tax=Eumeta variegata TaxID=151549 RepID=A0A4C1W615_EUMVA|nr:hypothetical protein EVAR_10756_1 [Eumeta japonica]